MKATQLEQLSVDYAYSRDRLSSMKQALNSAKSVLRYVSPPRIGQL